MVEKYGYRELVSEKIKYSSMTNFEKTLSSFSEPSKSIKVAGKLFVIKCTPDIFTGEIINIGVCAIDGITGDRYIKIIEEPGRLSCFYGDASHAILSLAKITKESLLLKGESPSPQVVFGEMTSFYNSNIKQVINDVFRTQVTAALPHRESKIIKMIDDDEALEDVSNYLKEKFQLGADFLANTPNVIINTDKGARAIKVPFQPANGVGTIRSAYYSPQALKTHLMDSYLDMECAARYRKKSYMALFILRPKDALIKNANQVDAVIDSISYRAPKNMLLEVSDEISELAEAINSWGRVAA